MIATGIVSSGLIGLLPELLRFGLTFIGLSYFPGEILRRVLGRPGDSVALRVCFAFFSGFSFHALVGMACRDAGAAFSSYLVAVQVASFAVLGAAFVFARTGARPERSRRSPAERLRAASAPVVALLVGAAYCISPVPLDRDAGVAGEVAYVRAIVAEDDLSPVGVLAPDAVGPTPEANRGMFHPFVAAVATLARVDCSAMWPWLVVILAPLACLAFFGFASCLLRPAYAAGALALFLAFQGGHGPRFLETAAAGPGMALVYVWIVFASIMECNRAPLPGRLLATALLVAGGLMIHVNVAIQCGVLAISLLMFSRAFSLQGVTRITLMGIIVACAIALWVDASLWRPAGERTAADGLSYFYSGQVGRGMLDALGGIMAVVGLALVPTLLWTRRERVRARTSLALAVPPMMVALVLLFAREPELGLMRPLTDLVPVWVVTALVMGSLVAWAGRGNWIRKAVGCAVLFVWAELAWTARPWVNSVRADSSMSRKDNPVGVTGELVDFIRSRVPRGSVLLSDLVTSHAISARCDVKVVGIPPAYGLDDREHLIERAAVVRNALSPYTTQIEAAAIVQRFEVDYILLNRSLRRPYHEFGADWDPAMADALEPKLSPLSRGRRAIYDAGGFVLYQCESDTTVAGYSWFPNLPFSQVPEGQPVPCERSVGDALRISGLTLPRYDALAGDTLRLAISYRRDSDPPSDLPLVVKLSLRQAGRARTFSVTGEASRLMAQLGGEAVEHSVLHKPFDGLYTPEMWPIGIDVHETVRVNVPGNLRNGKYDLYVDIGYEMPLSLRVITEPSSVQLDGSCAEVRIVHQLVN